MSMTDQTASTMKTKLARMHMEPRPKDAAMSCMGTYSSAYSTGLFNMS